MKIICIPGVNGLGMTNGVEKSFREVCKGFSYESVYLDRNDLSMQLNQIYSVSKHCFRDGGFFFVGGDHSISYPIIKSFFERYKENSKLLIFDAHPDLMEPMQEPTHEEWLRGIVELGLNTKNILIVGVRRNSKNVDKKEISFAKKNKINLIYSDEFEKRKKEILDFVSLGKVYLSFDIDVFDSSIISSTGYPEKEGLTEDQVFFILNEIKEKLFSGDLVEINLEKGDRETNKEALLISRKLLKTILSKEKYEK
jgi:agmatinase